MFSVGSCQRDHGYGAAPLTRRYCRGDVHTSLRRSLLCSVMAAENDLLRYVYYSIQVDSIPSNLQLGNEINELVEVSSF
jgi:hypothetical protein